MKFILCFVLFFTSQLQAQEAEDVNDLQFLQSSLNLDYNREEEEQGCSNIDLRDRFEEKNIPDRRHQDTTGWCYAFVAADLVSYELGENVSAADIARQYLNEVNPQHLQEEQLNPLVQGQPLGGGHTIVAINSSRENGFCPESQFPSQDYAQSAEGGLAIAANDIIQVQPIVDKSSVDPDYLAGNDICLERERLREIFVIPQLDRLLDLVRNRPFSRILNNIAESEDCPQRLQLPADRQMNHVRRSNPQDWSDPKNQEFYETINDTLGSGRPLSLGIDPRMYRPNPRNAYVHRPQYSHQVIAAGRRFNHMSGRCEYLIRNSESTCLGYNEEYECENNHVWVPRKMVQIGTSSIDYFSGPQE